MTQPETVTAEEAEKRGVDALLDSASQHPVAVTSPDRKVVYLLSADVVERALDQRNDLLDALLVVARKATGEPDGKELEEFLTELGLTDEEINAADA